MGVEGRLPKTHCCGRLLILCTAVEPATNEPAASPSEATTAGMDVSPVVISYVIDSGLSAYARLLTQLKVKGLGLAIPPHGGPDVDCAEVDPDDEPVLKLRWRLEGSAPGMLLPPIVDGGTTERRNGWA